MSRRQCMIWERSGRNCPSRQMAEPVLSSLCTNVAEQLLLVLGGKLLLLQQSLGKETGTSQHCSRTGPAQHPRKGLGDRSKGPAASVAGTCVSALVTSDGTDSHFSKVGGLWALESLPSPYAIAGAGTNQTLPLMVPVRVPSGLGCWCVFGGPSAPREKLTALCCSQPWLV